AERGWSGRMPDLRRATDDSVARARASSWQRERDKLGAGRRTRRDDDELLSPFRTVGHRRRVRRLPQIRRPRHRTVAVVDRVEDGAGTGDEEQTARGRDRAG